MPCERCQSSLIHCSYSPSRRHGKQSWAKRVAEQQRRYLQSSMYDHTLQGPATMNSFPEFHPGMIAIPSTIPPVPPTHSVNNLTLVNGSSGTPPTEHSFSVANHLPMQDPWSGSGQNIVPLVPLTPTSMSTYTISEEGMSPIGQMEFQTAPTTHDCEAKALATLHSLLHSTALDSVTTSTEYPNDGEVSQQLPSLDRILHLNRVALSTIRQLIECPCAQQPHLALLYMGTISKTLVWYRIAVNLSFRTTSQFSEARGSSSPKPQYTLSPTSNMPIPTTDTAASRPPVRPRANTVQIGAFALAEEDEAILVRNVIAIEIKKASRLVEFLKGHQAAMIPDETYRQASPNTDSWYRIGGEKLEREIQDTLREVIGSTGLQESYSGANWPV